MSLPAPILATQPVRVSDVVRTSLITRPTGVHGPATSRLSLRPRQPLGPHSHMPCCPRPRPTSPGPCRRPSPHAVNRHGPFKERPTPHEEDKDELFNVIADQIHGPTWMTPIFSNGDSPEPCASSPSTSVPATSQAWPSESTHAVPSCLTSQPPRLVSSSMLIVYAPFLLPLE